MTAIGEPFTMPIVGEPFATPVIGECIVMPVQYLLCLSKNKTDL
jgi:hypothetical protein